MMVPTVRDLSPESIDLLQRQITALFPPSRIAGLYYRRTGRMKGNTQRRFHRIEIRCGVSRQNFPVADFPSYRLVIEALPVMVLQMQKCRAPRKRSGQAARRAA